MTIHNFMLDDVAGCLKAIALFPLFLLAPGYAMGWLCDWFAFRRRTAAFRLALSLLLSIATGPIATYLLGRFCGMKAVWVYYGTAAVASLLTALPEIRRGRFRMGPDTLVFAAVAAGWLALTLFSLVDLQIDGRLYYPTSSFDYSLRTALVHSVSTTGLPPQTPLFFPGQPVPLRYHYFWPMMCSLVNQSAPLGVSARQALIGGTFWCGLALISLLAVSLKLFVVNAETPLRRRVLTGTLLLGITGLDIIPGLFFLSLYAAGAMNFVLPSLECWNEYVDWFLHTAIWAPHAAAALIAGFMGFLFLWHAPLQHRRGAFLAYAAAGGAALASAVGLSIWVAFVLDVFLCIWTVLTACKRWWRETGALLIAGVTGAVLAVPFLLELRAPSGVSSGTAAAAPLLQFTVRAFSLAALIPNWHGMTRWSRLLLVNGPLIPLNYLLEFGFFFLVGWLKWRQYRTAPQPLTRPDLACFVMLATSFVICTFLRSSVIGNNDLGWRGFLPAQFVLLLWSVDIFSRRGRLPFVSPPQRQLLVILIVLGALGTTYELAIVRFYPVLADRGALPPIAWMSPDRNFGRRNYAARQAYEWVRQTTPAAAAVQFNPDVATQETAVMMYTDRRMVAADPGCNSTFGGDAARCGPVIAELRKLYSATSSRAGIQQACAVLPVDLVIAKDTDPVWNRTDSWVWQQAPQFRNSYIRIFTCHSDQLSRR